MYAKQFKDEEITALKSQGMTNKEVAAVLGCSEKTVQRANVANRQKGHNRKIRTKRTQTYKTLIKI